MTTAEAIFMSVVGGMFLVSYATNRMQSFLIKKYENLLKDYSQQLEEAYTKDDQVLKYCLVQILNKAIEDEDYETAKRCRDLLASIFK